MAVKFVLDTSAYSAFNRGDGRLKKWINADNEIFVPLVVVGELRAGFAVGTKTKQNEELLRRFLDSPGVSATTITDKTTSAYAGVFSELRKVGKPIGTNDIWIAAICKELDISLLTLDNDFSFVPGLELIKL